MLLATDNYATYGILAAMVVAIWLLMWWTQRSMARSRVAPRRRFGSRDEEESKPAAKREVPPIDFNRWEVEMHDIMRSATGQLDSKMGLLEHLIREADRAAARLEAALAAEAAQTSAEKPGDSASDAARRLSASLFHGSQGQGPDQGQGNQAQGLRCDAPGTASPHSADEPDRPGKPRRYEEIYTLSDYGYGAAEIAQRLAMPIGEIELILGLRPQR